jgi:hypothetical protein
LGEGHLTNAASSLLHYQAESQAAFGSQIMNYLANLSSYVGDGFGYVWDKIKPMNPIDPIVAPDNQERKMVNRNSFFSSNQTLKVDEKPIVNPLLNLPSNDVGDQCPRY